MYKSPFLITERVSNNAFAFDKRENKQIYVPALKEGTPYDVEIGNNIVFEDYDEEGNLKSCKGLESFIKYSNNLVPVYIFDNHNHAFYFWHLEMANGNIKSGATLIHVDQHKDTRRPNYFFPKTADNGLNYNPLEIDIKRPSQTELELLFDYTNNVLNVGNFIPPAQKTGLIKNIINIDSKYSLERFKTPATENIILDIDLDFFAPELDYIDNNKKIQLIRNLIPRAKIITVATSPFFIDQNLAIKWLRKIFK